MSWLGGDVGGRGGGSMGVGMLGVGGGSGVDYPWWAAEGEQRVPLNRSIRCGGGGGVVGGGGGVPPTEYEPVTAVICAMFLVFGIVYCLFGYRCFKAVMFLTGFLFASVVVYLICVSEALLPLVGNAGVALGAGVLFGLITMLVQYVGLFMTGFHTGLFLGVALIAALYPWWVPPSVWAVVGLLLTSGLVMAVLTLYFQKGLTIIGTAVSGGAIMAATLDYFIEELMMVEWFRDRLTSVESEEPCWFSWVLLGVWPFMVIVGSVTQWRISGRGIYHQQMVPSVKSGNVNLHRLRSREARAELRQKKYRYLYQVRTAHGDIISQEYIQSLQRKAYPACDNGTLQSDSTHTTMLPPDQSQLAPLTESEDEGGAASPSGYYPREEEPMASGLGPVQSHGQQQQRPCSSASSRPQSCHLEEPPPLKRGQEREREQQRKKDRRPLPLSPSPPPPPSSSSSSSASPSPSTSGLQERNYRFGSPNLHPTPPPSPASPHPSERLG